MPVIEFWCRRANSGGAELVVGRISVHCWANYGGCRDHSDEQSLLLIEFPAVIAKFASRSSL